MSLITRLQRFFTGYDFFISYSRSDCSEYASNLANKLIEEKYSCYLDQWGSLPGKELPLSLKRKIKNSSVLILLGSDASLASIAIEEEINIFTPTKRIIIPVELCDISKANWYKSIEGIALSNEKLNFKNNQISTNLLRRLKNSLNYTRQSVRIRNSIFSFLSLILISIIALIILFLERKKSQSLNHALNDSIRIKTESVNKIENAIKLKEYTLEKMTNQFIGMRKDLDKKEHLLSDTNQELQNVGNELKENQIKLTKSDAGLTRSNMKVNEFTQRTLNNYEPDVNWNCEECMQKEFVILFEKDQFMLRPNYIKSLHKLVNCLNNHEGKIQLESYDFESSGKAYALKLSQRRGSSVATYFISQGISPERIIVKGLGDNDDGKKLLNLVGISRTEVKIK
ncbi:TIR domain-containing protein [Chryseobacterium sp. Leaf394]|uniref:TIR domain-containing protein n=1 Tax=Chryseobacterium sp. Leaf394 TaxID=1736361 RepID=UPI0007000BF4|nr:TIR domain-containing protein [Chryseobacterium sp. Leaf394]KQS92092.1 hypothetical protein ASG21_06460 [Chryseobacterium sp. Leaf394]